jgi:hypothetical protein
MDNPGDGWERADFNASSWRKGPSGFGTASTPNTTVRTEWNSENIWIRKSFELSAADAANPSQLMLDLYYDEDCVVYINGVKVFEATGYVTNYTQFPMSNVGQAIKSGANVIAIYCKQTSGGQYIDAGISRQIPPRDPNRRVW